MQLTKITNQIRWLLFSYKAWNFVMVGGRYSKFAWLFKLVSDPANNVPTLHYRNPINFRHLKTDRNNL
jgi:hypothetical protein